VKTMELCCLASLCSSVSTIPTHAQANEPTKSETIKTPQSPLRANSQPELRAEKTCISNRRTQKTDSACPAFRDSHSVAFLEPAIGIGGIIMASTFSTSAAKSWK